MRTSFLSAAFLGLATPAFVQAYTEGWKPGQSYTKYMTSTSTGSFSIPTAATGNTEGGDSEPFKFSDLTSGKYGLEYVLTHGPVARVISRLGFNVTQTLAAAREGMPSRFYADIPLLTDENYEEDLMDQKFSSYEEEEERVWAIMVSIGAQDPVSTFFDKTFDAAYNQTQQVGDLKHVRWARVDYLAVTDITTRWGIWKAPVLVIAKDRGRELRFFKVNTLRLMKEPEEMREFLINNEWESTPPWSGPWSPRGSRAHIMAKYAKYSALIFSWLNVMPRWLLLLITGSVASTVVSFLHAGEEAKIEREKAKKGLATKTTTSDDDTPEWAKEQEKEAAKEAAEAAKAAGAGSSSGVRATSMKKRKGKK